MTSTFATQFISGSPKAMCEHREKKVSCKRSDSLYKRVAAKRNINGSPGCIMIMRIKRYCAGMSAERKRNGLKLAVPVQPAKVHRRSLARSRQKWATIIRFLKILFLSLGRRWFIQIWCAPYPNIKYSSSEVSFSNVPYLHEVRFRQLQKESCS